MSDFRIGTFQRDRVPRYARSFCPTESTLSILDIDPAELAKAGKKLVLLDVDNTLLPWRGDEIPPTSVEWVGAAKRAGLQLCILSNTRHPERLHRIADQLGVKYLRGKFKPSKAMYVQALNEFHVKPQEAIMIGDQLFTDVLGANRSGIEAVWVRPMTGRDFIGTKVSRMGERVARRVLYRHIDELPPGELPLEEMPSSAAGAVELLKVPVVRQFAKFCIVGGTSFIIDYCVRMTLMFAVPSGEGLLSDEIGAKLISNLPMVFGGMESAKDAFFPVAAFFGAIFGMANSFIWNRRWTFRIKGKEERLAQLQKFVVVSVTGLVLNVVISSALNHAIHGDEKMSARIATIVAAGVVAFWNFTGQKFFAFKKKA